MKLRLPLSLKFALLACLSLAASAGAAEFVVDGVNPNDIQHSTRFYDNGKGAYWTETYSTPYKGAEKLYKETGDFSFMGELEGRINAPEKGISVYSFSNLTDDSGTCWYNSSSNILQYWQSYYGVFYQGKDIDGNDSELVHGHTYNREYAPTLGGTQSLKIDMLMYDSIPNMGGDLCCLSEWYFLGDDWHGVTKEGAPAAGYFADYFADNYYDYFDEYLDTGLLSVHQKLNNDSEIDYRHDLNGLTDVDRYVKAAFGADKDSSGNWQATEVGSLLYLGITSFKGGHALTCYGFETDENDVITSLYVTNSDDRLYTLFKLKLQEEEDGVVYMYKENGQRWDYAGATDWHIDELEWIMTPTSLKQLYSEYSRPDTALLWTGEGETWAHSQYVDDIPDSSSGWEVQINKTAYASHYYDNRIVRFDDTATKTSVTMSGALAPLQVQIDNSSKAYTFSGTEGATLDTPELVKSGTNTATFTGVDITAEQVKVGTGALLLGQNASLDINSQVVIKALGSESAAGMYSTNGNQTYSLGNSSITIENAVVDYIANTAGTLSNLLSNVKIVNNSTATLTENNSNNKSGISAHAAKGSIQFLNKGTEGITLKDAIIGTNLSLSVYKGTTVSEAEESALYIQGKLVGLTKSTINANLTMMAGSELDVSGTENTGINLGSALTFNLGMKLSEADVNAVLGMNEGGAYHLFNSVDSITLASSGYSNWTQAITVEDAVDASTYFTNLENGKYYVIYTGVTNGGANVGQVMLMGATVPEPATGTLSLLALAALAARRRRK